MNANTLEHSVVYEETIKRSRFLVHAAPCSSMDNIQQFLAQHSVADATHNCYAWRIGQSYRFNDDGEPSGTAGKPILQAIDGQQLDQLAVLVIRWFGGIKLGAGGLIRAYGGCAARCLQQAPRRPLIDYSAVTLQVPFAQLGILHQRIAAFTAEIQDEQYREHGLIVQVRLPTTAVKEFLMVLRDASSGTIRPHNTPA